MGWLSLIPIGICFLLIFISKNPFISIISGIVSAVIIVLVVNKDFILFDTMINVFSSSTIKTILFILIVGAIIKSTELSNGVKGLITYLEEKKINISNPVLVQLFTMLIGILLFVDGTSSMAIASVVGAPLFNKAKLSKEKLALITNSTASPIAWLIPFGGAGAMMTGVLTSIGIENAFTVVLQTVFFQFYTIVLLLILLITIVCKISIGSIKKYEYKEIEEKSESIGKARNMVIPIVTLLISIFTILLITGKGNLFKGNGTNAVFYGGIITLVITMSFYLINKTCNIKECLTWYIKGFKSMFVVTLLLAVAMLFGGVLTEIGTANFLLEKLNILPVNLLALLGLLLSAIISFSIGTSGGTVAIIVPLLIPMAIIADVNIALVLGAIVSGSVFGDQNSVISDSVIMTSSVTGVDTITHVKTQLPYTLISMSISAVLFIILGFIL